MIAENLSVRTSERQLCKMVAQAALYLAIAVLAAVCLFLLSIGGLVVCMILAIRPWDGNVRRDYSWSATSPYPVFWIATWVARVAQFVHNLKPGPLRATEIATGYVHSQVTNTSSSTISITSCGSTAEVLILRQKLSAVTHHVESRTSCVFWLHSQRHVDQVTGVPR